MDNELPTGEAAPTRERKGFALALTLGAVVIIGTLIAGAFYLSTQQSRGGRTGMLQERAFRYAEAGLAQSITQWDTPTALLLANGASLPTTIVPIPTVPASYQPRVTVTRLNGTLFQVVSEATVGSGAGVEATRRVASLVRLVGPTFNFLGALTVRGDVAIGGSSQINGTDQSPATWTCGATSAPMPGIAAPDTTRINTKGCSPGKVCVAGSPAIKQDTTAAKDDTYFKYGDYEWAELVSMANLKMTTNPKPAPTVVNGVCERSNTANWGDVRRLIPAGACETYFPIIYFPGDARLQGGTGQGILLVEGDLEISGGFQFFGPVVVRGRLTTTGTGGHLNGGVMAANVDLEQNTVLGDAIVNFSSCAITSAVQGAGRAMPIRTRSWSEMP